MSRSARDLYFLQSNELLKLDVASNGVPGKLTRLQLSGPVQAPDGLRSTSDGHFHLAENKISSSAGC